jgi:hypothetical protein
LWPNSLGSARQQKAIELQRAMPKQRGLLQRTTESHKGFMS